MNYKVEKINKKKGNNKKRIGIISYPDTNNIGNQLLKYAMNFILKKYGFKPILISIKRRKIINNDFLKKHLKIKEIKNYSIDLKESDYDYLIVNSDQVWAYNFKYILDIGFLSFAKYWKIKKIIYAASTGYAYWNLSKAVINSAKILIKQFSGISVREQDSIEMIRKYLGIKPIFLLDPTFLLDKRDYLEIIKGYKIIIDQDKKYLCSYILDKSKIKQDYIKNVSFALKYRIINIEVGIEDFIEKFIFSINICKLMITDSYHGTVFSIIFHKPFITFINKKRGNIRFFSLSRTFELKDRFIYPKSFEKNEMNILTKIPDINFTNYNFLVKKSISFLKKNLNSVNS